MSSSSAAASSAPGPCSTRRAAGLRAALIEQTDIAAGTSGRSSRLIHGGLRYLEQLHFGARRGGAGRAGPPHPPGPASRSPRAVPLPDLRLAADPRGLLRRGHLPVRPARAPGRVGDLPATCAPARPSSSPRSFGARGSRPASSTTTVSRTTRDSPSPWLAPRSAWVPAWRPASGPRRRCSRAAGPSA